MIKELFLAIILGATLGFGATGAYFALNKNKAVHPLNTQNQSAQVAANALASDNGGSQSGTSPTPTLTASLSGHQVSIESPENESIVQNSKLTIKGSTSPNSIVVIRTPLKTYNTTATNTGSFEKDIEVDSGINLIQITSFSTSDEQADSEITVTYSTAKI